MAERYDARSPLRQAPERGAAADSGRSLGEDPLAELARLVHGRQPRAAPAKDQPNPSSKNDALNDLEAELMNDLQASFAAIREAAAPPEPEYRPEPPPDFPSLADVFTPREPHVSVEDEPEPEPQPPPAREPPPDRVAQIVRPPEPDPERTDVDSEFRMRPTAVTPNYAAPPRSRSRWEQPEPPKQAAAASSRFAPPRGAPAPQPQPDYDEFEEEADPFADELFADTPEDEAGGAFPMDALGAPGDDYGPGDDLAAMQPRRGRGILIVGAVLGVVIIGGVAYAMYFSGDNSTTTTPPTIAASSAPTKVTPDDTTASGDGDAQNKLIYDRINSGDSAAADTTLVTPNDGSLTDVPSDTDTDNAISRVILPGGPGIDTPQGDNAQSDTATPPPDTMADTSDGTEGPRKVRTVVVKPDGTIMSSSATDAPSAGADTATTLTTSAAGAADTSGAATDSGAAAESPPTPAKPKPVTDDTQAVSGGVAGNGKELVITPNPSAAASTTPASSPPPAQETPPAKTTPATTTGASDTSAPATMAAPVAGGFLVQVSSQRSEEAARATFHDLQARYPRILGKYDVNIQRAEIPDRGIFYRARVGPFSQSDAQRLCDDLKSAGGDCLLTKR